MILLLSRCFSYWPWLGTLLARTHEYKTQLYPTYVENKIKTTKHRSSQGVFVCIINHLSVSTLALGLLILQASYLWWSWSILNIQKRFTSISRSLFQHILILLFYSCSSNKPKQKPLSLSLTNCQNRSCAHVSHLLEILTDNTRNFPYTTTGLHL